MIKFFTSFVSLLVFVSNANASLDFSLAVTSGEMQLTKSIDEQKYVEVAVSANYNVSPALAVEASIFGRSLDDDKLWGAQVIMPLSLVLPGGVVSSYLAPGYRYMNDDYSAPVLEGGLNLHFLGRFGVGYRLVFNEWVKNGLETESQFFIRYSFY